MQDKIITYIYLFQFMENPNGRRGTPEVPKHRLCKILNAPYEDINAATIGNEYFYPCSSATLTEAGIERGRNILMERLFPTVSK